jgi:hypothetical protein
VVLSSSEPVPGAGSWVGLVLGSEVLPGTVVSHVAIRHAGQPYMASDHLGCLTVDSEETGRILVRDSTFDTCLQSGVAAVKRGVTFQSFGANTFRQCAAGVWLNATAVGSIDDDLVYEGTAKNIIKGDLLEEGAAWRAQPVPWHVQGRIEVGSAATSPVLTISAGSTLRFSENNWLGAGQVASGSLVLDGTVARPVVLESQEVSPAPGAWVGVVLGDNVAGGTRLANAVIRHGGQAYYSSHRGCVTIDANTSSRVSVTGTRFQGCAQSGVAGGGNLFAFRAFSGNTFEDCVAGVWVDANSAGGVDGTQTYVNTPRNRLEGDTVKWSATWASQGIPWDVDGRITVDGEEQPVLTLEAGVELRFGTHNWLTVGTFSGGGLVAAGTVANPVVLGSRAPAPAAGNWVGVLLNGATLAGTSLSHVTVRHAGEAYFSDQKGGVTLDATGSDVSITDSTFQDNAQADIYVDCGSSPTMDRNVATVAYESGC